MPTNNGPMPPAGPYAGGNINPSSKERAKISRIVKTATSAITSTRFPAIPHLCKEKYSQDRATTEKNSQKPETPITPINEKTSPQDLKGKEIDFDNFFSEDPILHWILFSLASVSLIFTVYYSTIIHNISINHLQETQSLLKEINYSSNLDWAKINDLRKSFYPNLPLLIISITILLACFHRAISIFFEKYSLITLFFLGIVISLFTLHHFKYIGDITIPSIVTTSLYALFTIPPIAFRAFHDRKGSTYTKAEQVIHYIAFTLLPIVAGLMTVIFILVLDSFFTSYFHGLAPRTTWEYIKEFLDSPDSIYILFLILFISLVPNLMTATSIVTTIEEIFQKKRRKKAKKRISDSSKKYIRSIFTSHIKLLIQFLPFSASAVFIFVIIHYTQVPGEGLSTAIQITSDQFTENKYFWITTAFFIILISYIAFIPYFLLPGTLDNSKNIYPPTSYKKNKRKEIERLYGRVLIISSALTFFTSLINYQILKMVSGEEIVAVLLLITFLSFAICAIATAKIFNKTYALKRINKTHPKTIKDKKIFLVLAFISTVALSLGPTVLIPNLTKDIGDLLATHGDTDYSCVFSNNIKENSSIAFGVLAESKPDSVNIFSPVYDQKSMRYGKDQGDGNIKLNNLVKTQVKIPGGYHIENFNNRNHRYNLYTGKCEYTKARYSLTIINSQENQNRPPHKY